MNNISPKNGEERPVAIKISNVKKMYKLGQIGGGTLQRDLQSWWARLRHKEDPNTKIGEKRLIGQTFMALNGIDLTIYQGEAVGIIGHNGAGKSTLLKLLSRVTAPTDGEIDIYGRITSMLEVGTGFNGEMTGRENIYMNGAILGMTKAEIDAKMEQIIEFSEVRDFIDTPVKRYSSGMYVKLAFSVAAHLDSEIMIMDEVLAVGDMAFQKKCLDKMREAANKEGRTVLYVSHNMNTIRQLCDRCIVLNQGRIQFSGDVEEAILRYIGNGIQDMGTDIDLSNMRMNHLPMKIDAKMLHLVLCKKDNPIYSYGDSLDVIVDVKANKKIGKSCFRIEFRTEEDIPVGAGYIHNLNGIEINKIQQYHLNLNMSSLIPGKYKVCLVYYEVNEFGTYNDLDAIYPAFTFEVTDNKKVLDITWDKIHWGNISFTLTSC